METVLVTAIGSLSADVVIKSLKRHDVHVIGCDIFPKEWVVDAFSVDQFFQVPRGVNKEKYLSALQNLCVQNHVDMVIPLTDAEIDTLNDNREWFETHGVRLCISPKETIDICRNKYRTFQLLKRQADRLHFEIIDTILGSDYCEQCSLGFPLVCKPLDGRSSQGMRRIGSKKELIGYLDATDPKRMIIQPMIDGMVVTVDVIRSPDGETVVAVPREELLRTSNGAGTTVHVFFDEMLAGECRELARILGIIGCVNFEFIRSKEGNYYFLECNPRFSGGVEFSCLAGYDFVWNHLRCFSGQRIESLTAYQKCYIARKYEEYITAID